MWNRKEGRKFSLARMESSKAEMWMSTAQGKLKELNRMENCERQGVVRQGNPLWWKNTHAVWRRWLKTQVEHVAVLTLCHPAVASCRPLTGQQKKAMRTKGDQSWRVCQAKYGNRWKEIIAKMSGWSISKKEFRELLVWRLKVKTSISKHYEETTKNPQK